MATCNIGYTRADENNLKNFIVRSLWNRNRSDDQIQGLIKKTYGGGHDFSTKVSFNEVSSGSCADFIDAVTRIIKNLDHNSLETLSDYAKNLRNVILSTFFDMSNAKEVVLQVADINNAGNTDQNEAIEAEKNLQDVIQEVYGPINTGLRIDLENSFSRELRKRLIYDPDNAIVHRLNRREVNQAIIKYKKEKFDSILKYLKEQYPNDGKLQNIKSLYDRDNYLNLLSYKYVINKFQEHLKDKGDLGSTLNDELDSKISYKYIESQTESYQKLLNLIKENNELLKWFNNKFSSLNDQSQSSLLFIAGRFSHYFNTIEDKLLKELEKNPNVTWGKNATQLLEAIHNPNKGILEVVNDYIKLTYFDDLLNVQMKEYVTYNKKAYQKNNLSNSVFDEKYEINASHKHQNSGFETFDKENSESHTSTTVKNIISDIPIFKYNDVSIPTGEYMSMNGLIQAWQALLQDITEGTYIFDSTANNVTEIQEELLKLANSIGENAIDNPRKLLHILFTKPDGWQGASAISRMKGNTHLTEGHKNILYSFYQDVLNTDDNPYSKMSIELNQVNSPIDYTGEYLPLTSDLVAVLYRNVNNNFLECNLQGKNKNIGVKAKFNWDSDLFDLVEGCDFASKLRQRNLINVQEILDKYNYSYDATNGTYSHSIILPATSVKLTLQYNTANASYGLFHEGNVIQVIDETKQVLENLDKIDLNKFKQKYLSGNQDLTNDEKQLLELLQFFDQYLKIGFLSESGLNALREYKENYNAFHKEAGVKVYGNTYLQHFLKLAMRTADVDKITLEANEASQNAPSEKPISVADYLKSKSRYISLITNELQKTRSQIISPEGNKIYFAPISTQDAALSEFARYRVIAEGRSTKSTSLNRAGATVANYSVARLGSELNQRITKQRALPDNAAAKALLFVKNDGLLDMDPVIDGEVTTLIGEVKAVRDMSSGELIQHAIFDKFYKSFILKNKICFQPTVYSDKTQFLNYFAKLPSELIPYMNLSKEGLEDECIGLYTSTFFAAHRKMQSNIINKYAKLFSLTNLNLDQIKEKLRGRLYDNTTEQVEEYKRLHPTDTENPKAQLGLKQLVSNYNKLHPSEPIELELDKDYRVRTDINGNEYCEFNEIIEHYADLAIDDDKHKKIRKDYFQKQKDIFASQLKEYGVKFTLFNSQAEMEAWQNYKPSDKEEQYNNYLLDILSSTKLLKYADRKWFIDNWVNKNTGELIIQNNQGDLNPFLERYFYIEGLYSNNLRMSMTGSEINHPDKAKNTLYSIIRDGVKTKNGNKQGGIKQYLDALEDGNQGKILGAQNSLLQNLNNHGITEVDQNNLQDFINAIVDAKSLNDLRKTTNDAAKKIYNESIVAIINTAEGTQFKRNVIATATLQHPVTGKIDGISNEVTCAVIYDMKAPVNNLRESDEIDAQDGSAQMSPIQVHLENNSLGDQRVGTNRKPIWDDQTSDCSSFLAKFAAFGLTNSMMINSAQSTSGQYRIFKKMHHIRWNGTIDLIHSIQQLESSPSLKDTKYGANLTDWFTQTLLKDNNGNVQKLYYKNAEGDIMEIFGFGKKTDGTYYTLERHKGMNMERIEVEHWFDDVGNHYTQKADNLHTIDSLFELHKALGGIYNCDINGNSSEFNLKVLTNFVNNVGYKTQKHVESASNVYQPLKSKFIAYVFNSSAVKNGAKNINSSSAWTDDSELSTFKLSTKGLGIQLNADHDVTDSELTEFSQVIAACAAYGKKFNSINDIYYGLAQSAFEASKNELTYIDEFLKNFSNAPQAKYKLYKIVGKLILKSKSNSDLDLTEHLKQDINKTFAISTDTNKSDLKIPFSDPSLYTQFITAITSVINNKSIKRKHPGSGYVMAPGYNVVQYYQLPNKNGEYQQYMYSDVLRKAQNDYRGKLITAIKIWNRSQNSKDPEKITYKGTSKLITYLNIAQLKGAISENNIDLSSLMAGDVNEQAVLNKAKEYIALDNSDTHNFNVALIQAYIAGIQKKETARSREWFMPTDNVHLTFADGREARVNLDNMNDFYKFKNGITEIELEHGVNITTQKNGAIRVQLKESTDEFKLEKNPDVENGYFIHFRTGNAPTDATHMRRTQGDLTVEQKQRLFRATLTMLPVGATLHLSNTTREQIKTKTGGLTLGAIRGFQSINPNSTETEKMQSRIGNTVLEIVGNPNGELYTYFDANGQTQTAYVHTYKKTNQTPSNIKYQLDISSPVNLKPSLIRWKYIGDDNQEHFMTIYDHPIIKDGWMGNKHKQSEIQKVLDDLDKGTFTMNGKTYNVIKGSLENTEAELVMGNMYKDVFGIGNESLSEILDQGEDYFKNKMRGKIVPELPRGLYDLAFTKSNGHHVLITLGHVEPLHNITEVPIDGNKEEVKDTGEIYLNDIKIGKYITPTQNWTYKAGENNTIGTVIDSEGNTVDPKLYRLINTDSGNPKIQERVNYITKYSVEHVDYVNGIAQPIKYTLYKIAHVKTIAKSLEKIFNGQEKSDDELGADAFKQISSILKHLYDSDKYSDVMINPNVYHSSEKEEQKRNILASRQYLAGCLQKFASKYTYDTKTNKFRELSKQEIGRLSTFDQHMIRVKDILLDENINFSESYKSEVEDYHLELAPYHKQWVSFLNSLHFISSRIPAQSLQSFMPMKCVGWTSDTSNTAYVSYIQTYLQGSDYKL